MTMVMGDSRVRKAHSTRRPRHRVVNRPDVSRPTVGLRACPTQPSRPLPPGTRAGGNPQGAGDGLTMGVDLGLGVRGLVVAVISLLVVLVVGAGVGFHHYLLLGDEAGSLPAAAGGDHAVG